MSLINNLVSRQDKPMLKTNGSFAARETYSAGELNTLVLLTTNSSSRISTGLLHFTMTYRFAGLINPDIPLEPPLPLRKSLAFKLEAESP